MIMRKLRVGQRVKLLRMVLGTLALVSCRQQPAAPVVAASPSPNEAKLAELEKAVSQLQATSKFQIAYLKPGSPGWVVIETTDKMPLRVGMDEVKPNANGSEVTVQIGNPSSVSLRECSLQIGWGETKPDGTSVRDTWHDETRHFAETLPAGDFVTPKFQLADITPEKLGAVTIGRIECLRWLKAR